MPSRKIAFILDAPEYIHPEKDSSLVLIEEAKRRGFHVDIYQQHDLVLRDTKVFFNATSVVEYSFIFMRKDPPVDQEYIYTVMLLDLAQKEGVKVINSPASLMNFNEKLMISVFPDCIAPTLTTNRANLILDFLEEYHDIIIKPLDGKGGKDVFRLKQNDPNLHAIIETVTHSGSRRAMVQQFIPEIKTGDKRIIVMHGEALPYALLRIAKPGETRANLDAGGSYAKAELTERDKYICSKVGPVLKANGIYFAGIDVIGNYLTEINITSPTCLRQINDLFGVNTAGYLFDELM